MRITEAEALADPIAIVRTVSPPSLAAHTLAAHTLAAHTLANPTLANPTLAAPSLAARAACPATHPRPRRPSP